MIDWLLYILDVLFDEMYFSFEYLGKNVCVIFFIINSLKMVNKIFKVKESIFWLKWIFVFDLDVIIFMNILFLEMIYILILILI